jgi:hypothetical protein
MLMLCINFVQKSRTQKRLAIVEIFANLFLKIHIFWDTTP